VKYQPVRVTRMIEYTYETADEAVQDMERWKVPPNGTIVFNGRTRIRSATIGPVFGESTEMAAPPT